MISHSTEASTLALGFWRSCQLLLPPDSSQESGRALEETSFNSHHQDRAQGTASKPPDPHWVFFLLVERMHGVSAPGVLFSLVVMGCVSTAYIVFLS